MKDKKHNGWTNYATWRVQLEIVSDWLDYELSEGDEDISNMSAYDLAEHIKDYVEELISSHVTENENGIGNLIEGYAMAFLNEVNWYELAESAQETAKEYA